MTESESVALPLGDTPLTNAIITKARELVKSFFEKNKVFLPAFFNYLSLNWQKTPIVSGFDFERRGLLERFLGFFDFSVEIPKELWYNIQGSFLPVAQLDSASDSDSEGRRFKSFRAGQKNSTSFDLSNFFIHCESNGISSHFSVYLITEGVYHQP